MAVVWIRGCCQTKGLNAACRHAFYYVLSPYHIRPHARTRCGELSVLDILNVRLWLYCSVRRLAGQGYVSACLFLPRFIRRSACEHTLGRPRARPENSHRRQTFLSLRATAHASRARLDSS